MTDLEKRAEEYADKRARAYNMPKSSFVIPLLKVAYKTGATQETALLSQHILDHQKDKVRELEEENTELKGLVNQYKASKCSSISLVNRNMIMFDQLTNAKELLKKLLVHSKRYIWIADDNNKPIMQKEIAEAEQFLKDCEVAK